MSDKCAVVDWRLQYRISWNLLVPNLSTFFFDNSTHSLPRTTSHKHSRASRLFCAILSQDVSVFEKRMMLYLTWLPLLLESNNLVAGLGRTQEIDIEAWDFDYSFSGIETFAHLPHTKCLINPDEAFDIAIVGAPLYEQLLSCDQ